MTGITKKITCIAASILMISAASSASAEGDDTKALADMKWDQRAPVIAVAPVWHDTEKDVYGMYVRIKAGATVPHHTHTFDYHGVVLQGNWVHYYGDDLEEAHALTLGDYGFQAGTEVHTDGCAGPEDCIFYITIMGTPDNIPYTN